MFISQPTYKLDAVRQIAGPNCHDFDDITPDQIRVNTIKNPFVKGIHNDVSLTVNGRALFLIEAQSTWTVNIIPRIECYYHKYFSDWLYTDKKGDIYGTTPIAIPRPYFCCVYTGTKDVPDEISLRKDFAHDSSFPIDLVVKVIHNESEELLGQYVAAARLMTAGFKEHGYTKETAQELIDKCIKSGYLVKFMTENKGEVMDILEVIGDAGFWEKRHIDNLEEEIEGLKNDKQQLEINNQQLESDKQQLEINNQQLESDKQQLQTYSAALAAKLDNAICVHLSKCHGMTRDAAMNDLAQNFRLDTEEAETYMRKHWDTIPKES